MDIILYLILSSIPHEPRRENISSDDVPTLQKEDIKVETLSWKVWEKLSFKYLNNDDSRIHRLTQVLYHNAVNHIIKKLTDIYILICSAFRNRHILNQELRFLRKKESTGTRKKKWKISTERKEDERRAVRAVTSGAALIGGRERTFLM